MAKYQSLQEFGAGASIGMLLGLIMGLSASPVVMTVLGALAAGLLGLLGITTRHGKSANGEAPTAGGLRIFGFGLFCAGFLVIGILLRTHNALAPSLAAQEQELSASGSLSKSEIHQILLLKAFGLAQGTDKKESAALAPVPGKNVAATSASVLFAGQSDVCQVLRRDQYNSLASYLGSLRDHGGEFSNLADAISRAPTSDQEAIATALSKLLCD
jgi:hypothetical protein